MVGSGLANALITLTPFSSLGLALSVFWAASSVVAITLLACNERPTVVRMMGKILGRRPVQLIDFQNRNVFTLCRRGTVDGKQVAPVYWYTEVGGVVLNEDGTVDKSSDSCYIYNWLPLDTQERVQHILAHGEPKNEE